MKRFSVQVLLVLALAAGLTAFSQSTNAALTGNVLDPSGAVVPNAMVAALNMQTGVATTTVANEAGIYSFPSIQPGPYRLTVEAAGFRTYVLNDVNLVIGARLSVNFSLVLAGAESSVEVTAGPDPLLSTTASVGGVISGQRVQDLPLPDRDALGLVLTQPGLVGSNFAGARTSAVNVTRDGINVMDQGKNLGVNSVIFQNVDSVAEVRVITSPVDAELGRGSGQVQISTRSGTKEFHGSIFESHRNTVLNANGWFNNLRGEVRDGLILNHFGGRLGGPIHKDQTFFHFTYEGSRQRSINAVTSLTYGSLARQGVFRFYEGVQNGAANSAVPTVDLQGNPVKPATAIGDLQTVNLFGRDPNRTGVDRTGTIQRLLGVMPLPNDFRWGDGLNIAGYTWRSHGTSDQDDYDGRLDHHFNSRHNAWFTYTKENVSSLNGFMPRPFPGSPAGSATIGGTFYTAHLSSTLSASKLNEFHGGVQRVRYRFSAPWELPGGRDLMPTSGGYAYLPVFRMASDPIPTDNDPQGRIAPLYQYGDTFHLQKRKHNLKFGGEVRWASFNGFEAFGLMPRALFGIGDGPDVVGVNSFNIPGLGANEGTAQGVLMDLSGSVDSVLQTFNATSGADSEFRDGTTKQRTWRRREFSFFVQDDFKLKPGLTLQLGMRYDYFGVPWDANGRTAGLVGGSTGLFGISGTSFADMYQPGRAKGELTHVQLIGRNSPNPNTNLYDDDWNNFGPGIGLSWSIPYFGKDKTVLRAGYSVKYTLDALRLVDIVSGDQPGLRSQTVFTSGGYLDLSQIKLPLTPDVQPLQTVPLTDRNQVVFAFDNNLRTPYVQNWNLTIQRQLPANFLFDLRYVGSKGTKLLRSVNVNEINIFENGILDAFRTTQAGGNARLFDEMLLGFNLGNGTVNGSTVTGSSAFRFYSGTRSDLANNSVASFASFLNQVTLSDRGDLLRINDLPENWIVVNPQFGSALLTSNFSNSTYHSLQLNAERSLSRGLMVQTSYTWSRTLGDEEGEGESLLNSYRNGRNRHIDKRLLAFHRTHVMRNNATWELPFGPNKKFLSGSSGVVSKLLEKWQFGMILNLFSGEPMSLASGVTSFNQTADNTATLVGNLPKNTGKVKKIDSGVVYFDELKQVPDPAIARLTSLQLLNTRSTLKGITNSAGNVIAVNPSPGTLGTLSQTYLQGPGSFRFDVNLKKTFSLKEGKEIVIRADAINLLNSPVFGNPNTDINSTDFGRITTAGGNRFVVLEARISF